MALGAQDPQLLPNECSPQVTGLRILNKEQVAIHPHCVGWAVEESDWKALLPRLHLYWGSSQQILA